ncbi:TIGR02117 family protein [Aliarcobacter lanthieri]|uniref:TIGR02117 family protein n=1 Tax=Aliarcobacter lanthieri TaxID=1355374 RepID=UPI003AA93D5F
MLKNTIKSLFYILLTLFLFVFFYILAEYFLSRISQNYELTSNDYTIYIKSNGVHTDIVLPLENNIIKWNQFFPFEDTKSKNKDFKYISIGWGDKGFYLDTPTWSELKVSTAFIAGAGLGNAALHITYYKNIIKDDLTYSINISKEQYSSIVQSIIGSLKYKNDKPINIKTTSQYGENDSFYEAIGSYSIFHTCNTWTNKVLKKANLPSSKWVAFDDGILYQYKIALK